MSLSLVQQGILQKTQALEQRLFPGDWSITLKKANAFTVTSGEAHEAKASEVVCDVCSGVKLKAMKYCLF